MFDLDTFIIAIYCLMDDYYHRLFPNGVRQRGFAPELTDPEALTIAIVGEFLSLEQDKAIFNYFYRHYCSWFPALKDRTLLVRQWANLWQVEVVIWQALLNDSGARYDTFQVIDTLPVPLCRLQRAARRCIFIQDIIVKPDIGYCASKDEFYFGVKGGLRIASNGMIVNAPLLPARPHDSQLVDDLLIGVLNGAVVLGDKAFLDREKQETLQEENGVLVLTPLRRNMKPTPFALPTIANGLRQLIETVIGQLTGRFHVQTIRVRKGWTLLAKWYRKILAHTVCVWLNLKFGRNPLDFDGLVYA
jgi:hypothetical protein